MFRTLTVLALGLTLAASAHAQSASDKARKKLFERQSAILDKRTAGRQSASVRLSPSEIYVPGAPSTEPIAKYDGAHRSQFERAARDAARRHNVPEDLFLRLVTQESAWDPSAKSHKGAIGLAQLMPGTARDLRVDPHDPLQNLDGGARYLADQYRKFRSWRLALAAYNAGPAAVERHNGVPPYRETQGYVRAILGS
ncbi:MAG: lytic transglycosylase domain-containing protein [Pseudomonadota bacterium]